MLTGVKLSMSNKSISVVLPAYNEENNIAYVVNSIMQVLPTITGDFEIIAIDDGSIDRTPGILEDLKASYNCLRVIRHPKNIGYGAALRSGFIQAAGDLIFVMDADCQFDISEINKLVFYIEDYDIVAGFRIKRQDSFYRRILGYCFNAIGRIMFGIKIKDINCGFKLYRGVLLKKMNLTINRNLINVEIMSQAFKNKLKIKQIGVNHYQRIYGRQTGGSLGIIVSAALEICRLKLKLWGLTS